MKQKSTKWAKAWKERNPERHRALTQAYVAANREKLKAYAKVYRTANHLTLHIKTVCKKFGISAMRYWSMVFGQINRCAICGERPSGAKRYLCVDHDHGTGEARGLLCSTCNQALGLFQDRPGLLRAAADYLDPPKVYDEEDAWSDNPAWAT